MGHTGALLRGDNFNNGTNAGPLTVNANNEPSNANNDIGFRCARSLSWPGRRSPGGLPHRLHGTVPVPMG
jgi:hypothetical protein